MSSHRYSSEISSAFSWQMSESLGTCLYPAGVDSDSLCQCHTAVQRALQPVLSTTYVSFTNTIFSRSGTSRKTASILILARLLLRLWGQKQLKISERSSCRFEVFLWMLWLHIISPIFTVFIGQINVRIKEPNPAVKRANNSNITRHNSKMYDFSLRNKTANNAYQRAN